MTTSVLRRSWFRNSRKHKSNPAKPTKHRPSPASQPPKAAVLWTVAAFAFASIPHLIAMPLTVSLVIALIIAWRIAAAVYSWQPLPGWLRVILTVALVMLIAFSFGGLWGRRTATALLCVMLAAKSLEMYRVRDLRMMASVTFFLITTQFLFDESLYYLAYLIIGCWLSTLALIKIQSIRVENPRRQDERQTTRPSKSTELLASSARLLLISLPIALVLFVLFPRLAQPIWGLPDDVLDGKTGLSESMSPGSIANLYSDDTPAFRVEFDSEQPPPSEQLYWRGPILWNYDGTTWTQSFSSMRLARRLPIDDQRALSYEVQLEPHERRWLLALDHPLQTDRPRSGVTRDYQLVSREPITTLTAYQVISDPFFLDTPILDVSQRIISTRLPDDRNPRTLAMAEEWRQRYPDDRELAEALLDWFSEEPFFYSLDTLPLGRHSADEFLFDLREGYCEYYASAFAIFMRAAGVPTRVVTGYQGGFWNNAGQYLLVRQSDAHAWNEIWLEDEGWTRFDPTAAVAPQRIRDGSSGALNQSSYFLGMAWADNLRNRFDRLQHLWNRTILSFDLEAQVRLLERLGLPELRPQQIALLMLLTLMLSGLLVAMFLLKNVGDKDRDPHRRAWLRVNRRVNKLIGSKAIITETPAEWTRRVDQRIRNGGSLRTLSQLYQELRYGTPTPVVSARFIELAKSFRPLKLD